MINSLRILCIVFFAAIIGGNVFADGDLPPLHLAAKDGDVASVIILIGNGADVNAKTKEDWTPLHFAAVQGETDIALFLVKAGAD
ncbi:MAG: ankyrin repeat domain-containing protein, partial [Gammaproteobacteria bacterium]